LVFFVVILVCCAKKNLATLSETEQAFWQNCWMSCFFSMRYSLDRYSGIVTSAVNGIFYLQEVSCGRTVISAVQSVMKKLENWVSVAREAGLPDGLFSIQKSQFGKKFTASDWKMLVYFMAIWNI
jgi:hypothetical protein